MRAIESRRTVYTLILSVLLSKQRALRRVSSLGVPRNASESGAVLVTVLNRLVGRNPFFIRSARSPPTSPVVLRPAPRRPRGPRGAKPATVQPACTQPSQLAAAAAVAYRGKLAGRSVPTDRGACWGPAHTHRFCVPLDACWPRERGRGGGPSSYVRKGARGGGTHLAHRGHTCTHTAHRSERRALPKRRARTRAEK